MSLAGYPIIILREGTERTHGRDALHSNIQAAKVIADAVKSSFGPRGMDKMLVDKFGDVVVTNDGATILSEIDVMHPAARYIIELAKSQDQEVGDGTSSVVILAGELLKYAEDLVESGIHPTIIGEGYRLAIKETKDLLDKRATKYDGDRNLLVQIARIAMSTKAVSGHREELAELVVDAVQSIVENGKADISNILISKHVSEAVYQTELIQGMVLEKERDTEEMPKSVDNAKILLINTPLEIHKTKYDSKMKIKTIEQIDELKGVERKYLDDIIENIVNTGANVVFSEKNISDIIDVKLAKHGVLAVQSITSKELENLSKITGANIQTNISDFNAEDLGTAKTVEHIQVADKERIVIKDAPFSKVVTLIIHGGTEIGIDEYERSIHDALCVVRNVIEDNKILTGGGSVDIYIANELRKFKLGQAPVIQLVIEAFARGIESIPVTLASNAGLDPIEIVGQLNQKYKEKKYSWGIDAEAMKIADMKALFVYEPYRVKSMSIESAAETAVFLLRIDDIVAAKGFRTSKSDEEDWDEE